MGFFTCPECDTRFGVPTDAAGTMIECTDCPWTGVPTYVEGVERSTHRAQPIPRPAFPVTYGGWW